MNKLLKHIRAAFWFVRVDSLDWWGYSLCCGPRIQIFRNRRYPKGTKNALGEDIGGKRMYTTFRWGGQLLGLTIGDRGRSREYVRKQLGLQP
jgi:hypothetical protein